MAQQNKTFERTYILPKEQYHQGENERQVNDVRTHAIQQGLRPVGDVQLVNVEAHGVTSVRLTYQVPVVVAGEDETPAEGDEPEAKAPTKRPAAKKSTARKGDQ